MLRQPHLQIPGCAGRIGQMDCNTEDSPYIHREVLIMILEHLLQKGSLPDDLPTFGDKDERLLELLKQFELVSKTAGEISNGELSAELPVKGAMAGNIKALQASLRHLSWQAERVAEGDLSQRVDFMGDFSRAFNRMTEHIAQKREEERNLRGLIEARASELEREKSTALTLMEEARESRNALRDMNIELQKALERAEKSARDADEANRVKSTILTHISHEIRTPLNGIIGMADLLMEMPLSSVQREYIEITKNNAIVLLGLLNNVLDFAKLEAGRYELERSEFNLLKLVEDTIDVVALQAQEKDIEPLLLYDRNLPDYLFGDPVRLRQVLINLLGNAVKFTERGEVCLSVKASSSVEGKVNVRFEVRDTGPGISMQAQERLFTPFVQADSSVARLYGGTGLGLSISRKIVELMGGSIGVDSIEGSGSTFWFELTFELPSARPELSRPGRCDCRGRRFLVADDSASSRRIVRELIEEWGGEVTEAESEGDLLRSLEESSKDACAFDAVLLAGSIIRSAKGELSETIGKISACGDIPVLLINRMGIGAAGKASGDRSFDFTICKPIKRSRLTRSLRLLLGQEKSCEISGPLDRIPQRLRNLHLKILLVEDNTVNQKVISALLHIMGCEVDIRADGAEALEALEKGDYNLVLMDCQMPVMDGYEATRALREKVYPVRDHTIPVIAMTASVSSAEREKCRAAGMSDFIPKPVMLEELAAALARWSSHQVNQNGLMAAADSISASFNSRQLLQLFNGDMVLARSIVATFLEDIHLQINSLQTAYDSSDINTLIRRVHSIKGASGYIGAQKLFRLSTDLEKKLNSGEAEDIRHLIDEFRLEFNQVRIECEAFLQAAK